jgi:hypothetical protein
MARATGTTALSRVLTGFGGWPFGLQRLALVTMSIASSARLAAWSHTQFGTEREAAVPLISWLTRASAVAGLVSMIVSGALVVAERLYSVPARSSEPAAAIHAGAGTKRAPDCFQTTETCRDLGNAVFVFSNRRFPAMPVPIDDADIG